MFRVSLPSPWDLMESWSYNTNSSEIFEGAELRGKLLRSLGLLAVPGPSFAGGHTPRKSEKRIALSLFVCQ
jgi:hypothetical protein